MPEIGEIISVTCKTGVTDWSIDSDRIIAEGFVSNNILYLSNNQESPVTCFTQEIPFKHVFDKKDVDETMKINIKADVEHLNYSIISTDELELRIVVNASASIGRINEIPSIVEIVEEPFNDDIMKKRPSLVVYFVKPGDSLWSIAKKYITTEDMLRSVNEIGEKDALYPGQHLIVPRIAIN
jgi:LysM repeat protein